MELTLDQALQEAVAAHKEGKLQDAEHLYRAILQGQPNHPDANHNLGVLAVAVGKPHEAIPLFKLALEANPQIGQFWLSYIDALIKVNNFDDAKRVVFEGEKSGLPSDKLDALKQRLQVAASSTMTKPVKGQTLQEKRKKLAEKKKNKRRKSQGSPCAEPSREQLNHLLAHYQAGKLEEAEALASSLAQQFPKHPFGWKVLGAVFIQTGRLSESLLPMREAVRLSPQDADAHNNLGNSLRELGKLADAEASYRKAIALKSDFAEALNNLGVTLRELGRFDDAEASYRKAIALKPDYAEAHYNFGDTLRELGRLDDAEASCRKAIALKPGFAEAHRNMGVTLLELGRLEEAEASYRQAIALKPDYAEAHRQLAISSKFSSEDEQLHQMQALYNDSAISGKNRCQICFALAKASDDLEDFAAAFQFYNEGNALRKKQLGYHKVQDQNLFEAIKTSFPPITAHTFEQGIVAAGLTPVFITGLPRSGTTLVEQIISSHRQVTGAGELPFVSQYGRPLAAGQSPVSAKALTTFRDKYFSALEERAVGKAVVTDKMPQNFRFLGLIATALPEAKIIHVKRDPAAVCWANYTQYFVSDTIGYCYNLDDILHYHRLYEDLMNFFHQALPNKIYDLHYELLTENQEEETRNLISHLGLEWDDACLSPERNERVVATASTVQVRQKVYQGSSDKWKRYRPYLNGALDHFSAGSN